MKRNSVIEESLFDQVMTEKFKPTKEYDKLLDKAIELENEIFSIIGDNTKLKDKYIELNYASDEFYLESEKVLCCECIRLGFMLCLDILGFSQK